ncbi:beta-ketoacyl synthase N-terminal-like domain-containing protein [Nocardiopsis terrae]
MTVVSESPVGAVRRVLPVPVHAAGVVSTAGTGLDALAELLNGGEPPCTEPEPDEFGDYPPLPVRPVAGFRLADHIGRKGTRNLDRLTGFGLVACELALTAPGAVPADGARTGVVLGTSTGSIQSLSELARDTLLQERPYLINPARFPNTVMNSCAGRIAIRNGLRGMNATLAGGRLSSLAAFRHARVALSQGRADRLIVGGAEELSAPASWAWYRGGGLAGDVPVGEGCALFDLGRPSEAQSSAGALAELLACEVAFTAGRGLAKGLTECVRTALARSGVHPDQIDLVVPGAAGNPVTGGAEERALAAAVGEHETLPFVRLLGETYSASGALQLASVLALWRSRPSDRTRYALITNVGSDGNVGALVVRRRSAGLGEAVGGGDGAGVSDDAAL